MSNRKISELTELSATPADGDLIPVVDIDDTTDSANGTTKKVTRVNLTPLATAAVYGRSKLSTAPASASAPIAVGDNDTRLPTQGENDALVGTSGTPSTSNPYATKATTDLLATSASVTSAVAFKTYTVGAQDNATVKTYFNIQLPFILWTGSIDNDTTTTFDNWVYSDSADCYIPPLGAFASFISTASATLSLNLFNATLGLLAFNSTNIVILDWWAKLPATGTGDVNMGFGSEVSSFQGVWNDTSGNGASVKFAQKSTGELMAVIAEEAVGVSSEDISSGLTLTNWNNYRIELDLGTNAKFYVNGILKSTLSGANLEVDNLPILIGFGRSDTSLFQVTAPTLSLQMNP